MRKNKKICILTICIISLFVTTVYASAKVDWASVFADAIWKVARYGSNVFYNIEPNVETECGWTRSSTGTIYFNSEDDDCGACVKVKTEIGSSNTCIQAFAMTSLFHWFENIVIILEDPTGEDVESLSAQHNQILTYYPEEHLGEFEIRFADEDTQKWNCYVIVTDWDVTETSTAAYARETYTLKASTYTGNTNEYILDSDTNRMYIVPSEVETRVSYNRMLKANCLKSVKTVETIESLENEFYDQNTGEYVNALKNYSVGDNVYVRDVITEITYNEDGNYTLFSLGEADEQVNWPFAGNLLEQYVKGDEIELCFEVVEEYRSMGYVFESLNYFVDGSDAADRGEYLDINDYIVK